MQHTRRKSKSDKIERWLVMQSTTPRYRDVGDISNKSSTALQWSCNVFHCHFDTYIRNILLVEEDVRWGSISVRWWEVTLAIVRKGHLVVGNCRIVKQTPSLIVRGACLGGVMPSVNTWTFMIYPVFRVYKCMYNVIYCILHIAHACIMYIVHCTCKSCIYSYIAHELLK